MSWFRREIGECPLSIHELKASRTRKDLVALTRFITPSCPAERTYRPVSWKACAIGLCQRIFTWIRLPMRSEVALIPTTLSNEAQWPSPPNKYRHGCRECMASRHHILTVVSSDAEAITEGLLGEVARSLISCVIVRIAINILCKASRNVPRHALPGTVHQVLSARRQMKGKVERTLLTSPLVRSYILILQSLPATHRIGLPLCLSLDHVQQQFKASS